MQKPSASVATKGENGIARTADGRRFGQITKMRSGRWQARYTVPLSHESGRGGHIVTAPHTFEPGTYGKQTGEDWLRSEELRLQSHGADWRTLAEHSEASACGQRPSASWRPGGVHVRRGDAFPPVRTCTWTRPRSEILAQACQPKRRWVV